MRKSYEGKIKDLGIEGRNKATKSERILEGLVDPGWSLQNPNDGRTNWESSDFCDPLLPLTQDSWAESVGGLLQTALDMRPGHLPQAEHLSWKNVLGLDDFTTATAAPPTAKLLPATTAPTPNGPLRTSASANPLLARTFPHASTALRNNSAPASPRPLANGPSSGLGGGAVARPERVGKKRRYDESSYAGYQEGYDDDGYSTGGGMDERRGSGGRNGSTGGGGGGNKRQKRKVSAHLAGF